jgi:hypothetical protein
MIACLPTSLNAICCALCLAVAAIGIVDTTASGYDTAHSSACIPPIDPPERLSSRAIPR